MPESSHDLVAAKAARIQALLRQLAAAHAGDEGDPDVAASDRPGEGGVGPSWTGGWNN
jgi:hypothetical protein